MSLLNSFYNARYRCENSSNRKFYLYGGLGIKFLLSKKDIEFIWNRDKAYLMKQPTIDREDSKGNYILSNCRFIEKSENSRRAVQKISKEDSEKIKIYYKENKTSVRKMESIFCIKKSQIWNIINNRTR